MWSYRLESIFPILQSWPIHVDFIIVGAENAASPKYVVRNGNMFRTIAEIVGNAILIPSPS